jgi:hypothetical protein
MTNEKLKMIFGKKNPYLFIRQFDQQGKLEGELSRALNYYVICD